jgi:two-component system KDP operon response regulator KdpE/two-component system response regulator VicR
LVHFPILLVVDDDPHILRFLSMNLDRDGFEVRLAENGQAALAQLQRETPDLAIVDLLLPDMHGFELCRKIKGYLDIPIMMLTAVGTEESIIEGLEKYAEDYIVKPFRYRELRARINRLLKRTKHLLPPRKLQLVPGGLSLDFDRRVVSWGDREVALTPTECRLLACLARNPNVIVSRDRLMDEVWPEGDGDPLRLKVAIHRLRTKLEKEPNSPRYLLSYRGRGYKLAIP